MPLWNDDRRQKLIGLLPQSLQGLFSQPNALDLAPSPIAALKLGPKIADELGLEVFKPGMGTHTRGWIDTAGSVVNAPENHFVMARRMLNKSGDVGKSVRAAGEQLLGEGWIRKAAPTDYQIGEPSPSAFSRIEQDLAQQRVPPGQMVHIDSNKQHYMVPVEDAMSGLAQAVNRRSSF